MRAIFLVLAVFLSLFSTAQSPCLQGTILIDGSPVDAVALENDNHTGLNLPLWLNAGATLAAGSRVLFISVIEFEENGESGVNNLIYSQVLRIGSQVATVPSGKVWKVESIVKHANVLATGFSASSNTPVCQNQPINLSATSVSGATYEWTGPNGFTSTAQSPVISSASQAANGTYSVTAVLNGCASAPSATTVVVNPLPVSTFTSSPALVTTNVNTTFTPTDTGAAYSWVFPSGTPASSSAQNPVVQWSSAGNYDVTLTITDANGCTSSTVQVVSVSDCIPGQPSSVFTWSPQSSSPITFSPGVSGISYDWSFESGSPATSSVQNPIVTWNAGGTFQVSLTAISNGCSTTTTQSVTVLPQGCVRASDNTVWCIGWQSNQSGNDLCGRTSGYSGTYFAITNAGASAHGKSISGFGDCATNYLTGPGSNQIQGTSLGCWNNADRWNRTENTTNGPGSGTFPVVRCTNLE